MNERKIIELIFSGRILFLLKLSEITNHKLNHEELKKESISYLKLLYSSGLGDEDDIYQKIINDLLNVQKIIKYENSVYSLIST